MTGFEIASPLTSSMSRARNDGVGSRARNDGAEYLEV